MVFSKNLISFMFSTLFVAPAFAQNTELRSWPENPSEALTALETSIQECGPETKTEILLHRDRLSIFYSNKKKMCAYVLVRVESEQTKCEGVDTFAFAFGASELSSGRFKNTQGFRVSNLFGKYEGSVFGAGVIVGAGHWLLKKQNGIAFGDKRIAIPVPIMGGDIGLGYTSCRFSVTLKPTGPVELIDRRLDSAYSTHLTINDIANLPLF